MNHSCPSDLKNVKRVSKFALVHVSSTKDGVRANNATDAIVVWHRYIAFIHTGKLYIDSLSWCPSMVYVLEREVTSIVYVADDIRDNIVSGVDLEHSDFNPVSLTLGPAECLSAGYGLKCGGV